MNISECLAILNFYQIKLMGYSENTESLLTNIETGWMPLVPVFPNGKGPYIFAVDTGYPQKLIGCTFTKRTKIHQNRQSHFPKPLSPIFDCV